MKKVLSLVLALALSLGVSAMSFAKREDITINRDNLGFSTAGKKIDGVYHPDQKIEFKLVYEGKEIDREFVRKNKIDVRIRTTEGNNVIKDVKIKYDDGGKARVEVKFVDEWVSTKKTDVVAELYMTVDRDRENITQDISVEFENEKTYVYEGYDYVYLGDKVRVVEAEDYVKNIEVDLGQGVSIFTKMFDGKKYYGHVTQEVQPADEKILAQYPSIDAVYYFNTIGLASAGNNVAFTTDTNYYAYGQDDNNNLVYVGRTTERLPYYTKYFLSIKELDVTVDNGENNTVNKPGQEVEKPPVNGGDGETPANVNDNPGTGR